MPTKPPSQSLTFEQMLPRLVAAYERGLLVPFIGAGMSVGICASWQDFITALEAQAAKKVKGSGTLGKTTSSTSAKEKKIPDAELVRRGNRAVRQLKLINNQTFTDAVGRALIEKLNKRKKHPVPKQARMLARIFWPLVLTTNYDDLFLEAWHDLHPETEMRVVGRSAEDCHRLLASLNYPRAPLIWTLQGFLPGAAIHCKSAAGFWVRFRNLTKRGSRNYQKRRRDQIISGIEDKGLLSIFERFLSGEVDTYSDHQKLQHLTTLRNELVVGHREYRHVAFAQQQFRRTFAEVFRSRSFLFLGSSMNEEYFLNLFGEVLEIYGANPNPHYALIHQNSKLDVDFLRGRFNIFVHRYQKHEALPGLLGLLHKELAKRSEMKSSISFSVPMADKESALKSDHLQIVSGISADDLSDGDCICIPGHRDDNQKWHFSPSTRKILKQFGLHPDDAEAFAGESKKHLLIFDSASTGPKRSNLTQIGKQAVAWFSQATKKRCKRIRLPWTRETNLDNNFLRFKIAEAISAYGRWIRQNQLEDPLSLAIHLTDPGVIFDLRHCRIDPNELLVCEDIRFWIEIRPLNGNPILEIYQCSKDETLLAIARAMSVPMQDDWFVETDPPPLGSIPIPFNLGKLKAAAPDHPQTLAELGVYPSVTLTFIQVEPKKPEPEADMAKPGATPKKAPAKSRQSATPGKPPAKEKRKRPLIKT